MIFLLLLKFRFWERKSITLTHQILIILTRSGKVILLLMDSLGFIQRKSVFLFDFLVILSGAWVPIFFLFWFWFQNFSSFFAKSFYLLAVLPRTWDQIKIPLIEFTAKNSSFFVVDIAFIVVLSRPKRVFIFLLESTLRNNEPCFFALEF